MGSTPFLLRKAVVDEIETLWQIDQSCFTYDIAFSPDIFYYHLLIRSDPAFVAERNGQILGFIMTATQSNENGEDAGLVVTIDVIEQERRNGIGAGLMSKVEKEHKDSGANSMILQVSVDNDSAINFYKKLGYREEGSYLNYYGDGKHALGFKKVI